MPNPLAIETQGLENYLNKTVGLHNGMTYADFVKYVDQDIRPSNTKIAEKFGVSHMTITNWLKVYFKKDKEKK